MGAMFKLTPARKHIHTQTHMCELHCLMYILALMCFFFSFSGTHIRHQCAPDNLISFIRFGLPRMRTLTLMMMMMMIGTKKNCQWFHERKIDSGFYEIHFTFHFNTRFLLVFFFSSSAAHENLWQIRFVLFFIDYIIK